MIAKKEISELEIKILKMTSKNLSDLFKSGKAYWKDDNWLTMKYLKSSFGQDGLSYVAKSEGKIIGGVIFIYQDIVENWLRYLIVDKKYRRRGVGTALLQKVFKKIKTGESVFVDTGVHYKNTINFYGKLGFKNCGIVKNLYGNKSAYFLKKTIK